MATGFPPKYAEDVLLNNMSVADFVAIMLKAGQQLGWALVFNNHNSLVFSTGFSWVSWGEKVLIRVHAEKAVIESRCSISQITDWGRNKKNIQQLLIVFYTLMEQPAAVPMATPSDEDVMCLGIDVLSEEQGVAVPITEKARGITAHFIPSKEYVVTPVLVAINLIVFICMVVSGVHLFSPDVQHLLQWGGNYREVTMGGQYWRLLSACFIHAGFVHLVFNMFALIYVGSLLEPILGWLRYLVIYILAALVASAVSIWWRGDRVSVGASGAIFGLFGIFIALLTTRLIERNTRKLLVVSMAIFVAYNLLMGFRDNIDNAAHLGGLLSGFLLGYVYYPSVKKVNEIQLKYATILAAILITGVVLLLFNRATPTGGMVQYRERMESFISMEAIALSSVYDMDPNRSEDEKIFAIREHGIVYWKKCLSEVNEIRRLELPQRVKEVNDVLGVYCKKRISCYELMYKAMVEHTAQYDVKIKQYENEITEIAELLKQQQLNL